MTDGAAHHGGLDYLDLLCCPACREALAAQRAGLVCRGCGRGYEIRGGIPRLFHLHDVAPDDVTEKMKAFYEETPFPDYDDHDSVASLVAKARRGLAAKSLDDQIPFGARILEAGCGTGQLSAFLSVANRRVWGADMCENSLGLAQDFKERNGLERVRFLQMNLFAPCFREGSFDLVISNGVLHHTNDPREGIRSLARLVKPGGYLLVGLYHRWGRLITDLRRLLFRVGGDRFGFLDKRVSAERYSRAKRRAWFADQYRNPHESKHTIGQVARWLRSDGLDFVSSVPSTMPFRTRRELATLFRPHPMAAWPLRQVAEWSMALRGADEGGFFMIVGRRPPERRRRPRRQLNTTRTCG